MMLRDGEGFVLLPSLFSAEEVEALRCAADDLVAQRGPEVILEDESRAVKMVFGGHLHHETFMRLARHPRLLDHVERSLGEPAHVFQSRLNAKSGFAGGGWAWHQDFNQWYRQDGMRTPRATVVGVFLDDVNPCNGPLMMIPRSQHRGHIFVPDAMDIPFDLITEAAAENGIIPLMGPPGTALLFDCLTVHGSAPNVSPWPRRIFYLNYVPASCRELQPLRARHHCDTQVRALRPLADDCLIAPGVPAFGRPVGRPEAAPRGGGTPPHLPARGRHTLEGVDEGSPIRTRPFAPNCNIGGRERELLLDALESCSWSGFRAGTQGHDARTLCELPSAEVVQLAEGEARFLGGRYVTRLEAAFAARAGVPYAVACNSATSGLVMAAGALDLCPGDEVLVPCMSFHASATALVPWGCVPVFVEVKSDTLCIDPQDAATKITERTRAIMVVHLGGMLADMDAIVDLARRHNLRIIEDCAQALGATFHGREAGSLGDTGVYSLTETKSITCGEGGVLVTSDPRVARKARLIRNHGEGAAEESWSDEDLLNIVGMNFRLTELQAAVALAQFEQLDRRNAVRNDNAQRLADGLRRWPCFLPQALEPDASPACYMFKTRYVADPGMPSRDELAAALAAEGIPVVAGYPRLLHQNPIFSRRGSANCPRSEALNRELLWFPFVNPPNGRADMDDAIRAIEKVFAAWGLA